MKKKIAKKYQGLIYVYHHNVDRHSEYSHPELRIIYIDPAYPRCSPDAIIDFTSQCGGVHRENPHSIRQSYSLRAQIDVAGYRTERAVRLLNDLGFGTHYDHPTSIVGLVKELRSKGIPRYSIETTHMNDNGYENREFIPRKFKRVAGLYWQAKLAGKELI